MCQNKLFSLSLSFSLLFVSTLSINVWVFSKDRVGHVNFGKKPWDVVFS